MPLYVAVPLGPADAMAAFVERERAGGIHHFQLKLGAAPEEDLERVAAVHAVTGPEDALIGDANGAWRRQDAIIAARLFAGFDRLRLEQPCPTLEECIAVRRLTTLPMVLDEVITDLPTLVRAAAADAMDHVNLKVGRVGGLTRARAMRDAAVALGLTLTIEDSWGGDIVTAAVGHLAAGVPPGSLFAASYMNDWTLEHVAGYEPRSSRRHAGPSRTGRASGSPSTSTGSGRRCSARPGRRRTARPPRVGSRHVVDYVRAVASLARPMPHTRESMSAVIDHMRKVPLFRGMSTSALETVADRATETTFEDGETVTREGEPGETFYIVTDGRLHVTQARDPRSASWGRATSSARSP